MDGWILVGTGAGSLLCFLVGIWADWILGRADSDDDGRPDDYYLRASPRPQTGSLPDKQLLAIEVQRAAIFAQATQQLASPQWTASQAALAVQLAHTTATSRWNGGNYGQPVLSYGQLAESPLDRVYKAMRGTGCEHDLVIASLVTHFATEVIHDHRHRMECADIDGTLYHTYDRTDEVLSWLQSVCDGSDEFWSWHEAYGVWTDEQQVYELDNKEEPWRKTEKIVRGGSLARFKARSPK